MKISGKEILYDLKAVRWDTALQTYGNNHSTLIGLLVDWWVSGDLVHRRALEGGPTNGYSDKGVRGQCDALFCLDHDPIGVLEVEGTRYSETAKKIGTYFDGKYKELKPIRFGILLLYAYQAFGRGTERKLPSAIVQKAIDEIINFTKHHPNKPVIVISLDKKYRRIREGIRSRNEYYMGEPTKIQGRLYENGQEIEQIVLKTAKAS